MFSYIISILVLLSVISRIVSSQLVSSQRQLSVISRIVSSSQRQLSVTSRIVS